MRGRIEWTEKQLSWDQRQALWQLQLLLRRRCLAQASGLTRQDGRPAELLHALDVAIVGAYRLAGALEVGAQADALLAGFRAARFVSGACLEAPSSENPPVDQ